MLFIIKTVAVNCRELHQKIVKVVKCAKIPKYVVYRIFKNGHKVTVCFQS